jgi:hypothetical protein
MSVKVVIQTIALESMLRSASGPVGRHVFKMGVNIQSSETLPGRHGSSSLFDSDDHAT